MLELEIAINNNMKTLWERNDLAHREEHFSEVIKSAIHIDSTLHQGLKYREELYMIAAYVHDSFSWLSRKEHHLLSALYMREGDTSWMNDWIMPYEKELIAGACECHRSSYSGKYPSDFAEIFAAADYEGMDPPRVLERSMLFGGDRQSAIQHVRDKFGTGGTAIYPKMFLEVYGDPRPKIDEYLKGLVC